MAFSETGLAAGQIARSGAVLQILRALNGTANNGQPIALTKLNDGSNYALDVQNLGAGGAFRVKDTAGNTLINATDTGTALAKVSLTNITGLGIRDTTAAFDVTLAATSTSATITAGRTLTLDVGNVAHTLALGTTANTITFPNAASGTVPLLNLAQSFTALQTFTAGVTVSASGLTVTAGNVGVGTTPLSTIGVRMATTLTGATTATGIASNSTFASDVTSVGQAFSAILNTAAASFTLTTARGCNVQLATIGAGSAITTTEGLYVSNLGATGVTNAYGVYIEAQSGAATTNIGLYNAGTTQLASGVGIGAAPTGLGVNFGAASSNNSIWNASQGAGTATLYVGNASITVSSDIRLKADIRPDTTNWTSVLNRVPVRSFIWNDPSERNNPWGRQSRGRYTSPVAQELLAAAPELRYAINAPDVGCPDCAAGKVCIAHSTYWNMDVWGFIGPLIAAVQELSARVATLEGRP